mgnify:CR=1 FL=1
MTTIKIALLGFGTVAQGTFNLLQDNAELIRNRTGVNVEISKIFVRNPDKYSHITLPETAQYVTDIDEVLKDDSIQMVVELMGGTTFAKDCVEGALKAKKNVVTANKDLLAESGPYLLDLASKNGVDLRFEASVLGGIPIIRTLYESLAGNRITEIIGIMNGTTNFILTKMSEEGLSYQDVLKEAQDLGYAEADPTADVEGLDAARKLAILASISFNRRIFFEDVSVEGITSIDTEDIKFGYCTEIMVKIGEGPTVDSTFDYEEFRNYLDGIGDSLLVVNDDEIIKVHVHTENPGEVLNYGQKFGSLVKIKVDNMRLQHETILEHDEEVNEFAKKETPRIPYGIVAIAAGKGVQELFESLGANYVISGGQTMNPSTEDIVKAIQEVNADKVIVLPNNKNIFMAADQAAEVADIPVAVVPSRTISQGLTAMLSFNDQASLEENKETMTEMLSSVVSGQVTHAIRDTSIDGVEIKEGDFLGMIDGKILISNPDITATALSTLEQMINEDTEIVTILAGDEGTVEQANEFAEKLTEKHPDLEIEIHQGDQPVYPYLFSAE